MAKTPHRKSKLNPARRDAMQEGIAACALLQGVLRGLITDAQRGGDPALLVLAGFFTEMSTGLGALRESLRFMIADDETERNAVKRDIADMAKERKRSEQV